MTGPLLFAFVAWTLRETVRRGIRKLFFFARDGEILMKIVAELQPVAAPTVECRYLYVSRKSLHLPAVTEFGESQREWMFDKAVGSSLKTFLARLDIGVDEYRDLLPAGDALGKIDATAMLTESLVNDIERSLDIEAVGRLVLERAAVRRKECLAYLTQEGLLEPGPIGVVDIGWRGRLQRSICTILSTQDEQYSNRLHGFYFDLTIRRPVQGLSAVL
jgi:predicted HAD superfamily hydrolase